MGKNRCERMGKPQMDKESLDMIYEIEQAFQERREKRFIPGRSSKDSYPRWRIFKRKTPLFTEGSFLFKEFSLEKT